MTLFGTEDHVEVEATWGIYQQMFAAYREPDRAKGRVLMAKLIEPLSQGVLRALIELITLGRTMKKRAEDVLAYFERHGTSNGPTEAINGRLEHLPWLRPRTPQPHPLHCQILTPDRRLQTPTTPRMWTAA